MVERPFVRATCAIEIVERAYRLDGSESQWLGDLLHTARADLDAGCGVYAFTGSEAVPNLAATPTFVAADLDPGFASRLATLNQDAPNAIYELLRSRLVTCGGLEQILGAASPIVQHFRLLMTETGIRDGFCLFAQDAEGGSITLSAPSREPLAPAPRVRGIWQRVGLHVAAALRLRRKLVSDGTPRDALFSTSGSLEDASAQLAADHSAQTALRRAVRAMEQARSREVRQTPDRALELWQGLALGEWSLVDQWEGSGQRYVAAYQNRPAVTDPRALSAKERAVCKYMSLGASNKEIAYTLGLPAGTVSTSVSRILRKFRLRRRVELVALLSATHAKRFDLSDGRVGVLAVPMGRTAANLTALTPTERAVAHDAARGLSNERIASGRGVSVHTVAKQLRAIYAKLEVDGRSQLARLLSVAEPTASRSETDRSP